MQRKRHSAELKAKIALEAIKGYKTANEIASEYGVHPTQIAQWKKQVLEELPDIFSSRRQKGAQEEEALKAALYQQIGQLKVELDWLKKKLSGFALEKRPWHKADDGLVTDTRLCRQSQTRGTLDAYHGTRGDLSQAPSQSVWSHAAEVSLLVARTYH
jgi:transposase-like protein